MKLQTYKGYTVDYRLRQFRKVATKNGGVDFTKPIQFLDFDSYQGDELLAEMIRKDLIPEGTDLKL